MNHKVAISSLPYLRRTYRNLYSDYTSWIPDTGTFLCIIRRNVLPASHITSRHHVRTRPYSNYSRAASLYVRLSASDTSQRILVERHPFLHRDVLIFPIFSRSWILFRSFHIASKISFSTRTSRWSPWSGTELVSPISGSKTASAAQILEDQLT